MRLRRRQFDMPHALAPHARERHLDRALFADDALVLHALVLAAQALVVLDWPEDARAEQAVALRLEGAVVDGLRLLDLAVGPRQNLLRARDRDGDLGEDLRRPPRAKVMCFFSPPGPAPVFDQIRISIPRPGRVLSWSHAEI